ESLFCWQETHNRTPGMALRRASGIVSPHSSHSVKLSPRGISPRARATASSMVLLICSLTASSFAHPEAMAYPHVRCVSYSYGVKKRTVKTGVENCICQPDAVVLGRGTYL